MNQILEKVLANYKKANKKRKENTIKSYGFNNEKEFLEYLNTSKIENYKSSNVETKKIPTVHLVDILDTSDSMRGKKLKNALIGIKEDIRKSKDENGKEVNYTHSFITFNNYFDIYTCHFLKDINSCSLPGVTSSGMTALYDAIGQTLYNLKQTNIEGKVLVKIYTDGEENNSQIYNSRKINELIKEVEKLGFTITFVGTALDVKQVIRDLNIDPTNTFEYDGTAEGLLGSLKMSSLARTAYSTALSKGEDVTKGFFKRVGKL